MSLAVGGCWREDGGGRSGPPPARLSDSAEIRGGVRRSSDTATVTGSGRGTTRDTGSETRRNETLQIRPEVSQQVRGRATGRDLHERRRAGPGTIQRLWRSGKSLGRRRRSESASFAQQLRLGKSDRTLQTTPQKKQLVAILHKLLNEIIIMTRKKQNTDGFSVSGKF